MVFSAKKVGDMSSHSPFHQLFSRKSSLRWGLVVLCITIIFTYAGFAYQASKTAVSYVTVGAVKAIGAQMGEPMEADEFGNINVLIAGYGGAGHAGSLLTDTMMLASYNPKLGAVTFLSVPRDLYVSYGTGRYGKLNGLFWNHYVNNDKNLEAGAAGLRNKMAQITGVPIPYYMFVDFDGFVSLVDSLSGINVNVPQSLVDTSYPGPNNSYVVFSIQSGQQVLDGETALKYARSRHSTSDFSRALRQQLIIKAMVDKVLDSISITNPGSVRKVYKEFTEVMKTNISFKQIMGLAPYVDKKKQFFSFVYTTNCNKYYARMTQPGCFLYYPNRDELGGASSMLPDGATASNLSYYKHTQDFAAWVIHHQELLVEGANIAMLNGIDKDEAKKRKLKTNGFANDIAVELILRGFNVPIVQNALTGSATTKVYVSDPDKYAQTLDLLRAFVDIAEVIPGQNPYTGSDIAVIIGNDYLDKQ